jgi:5'-methylthioadenosine nucleosidase
MEAAAVAWAADLFHLPCFCIKSVTDIVDGEHPAEKEFLANLARAAGALQAIVPRALELIAGRHLGEL